MNNFIEISKYAGMREDLVQAGGGNSSYKESEEKMYIKASGYQLCDVTKDDGFSVVNPQIIKQFFMECDNLNDLSKDEEKKLIERAFISGKRPSIEIFLHAISGKYTLHTHPTVVNALTCRKNGYEILKKLFPNAMYVKYATPGIDLAKNYFNEYKKLLKEGENDAEIVFLQNHGLVVSGEDADSVITKTEEVLKIIEEYLKVDFDEYHDATKIWRTIPEKIVWKVNDANILTAYKKYGVWNSSFCPDCIVFIGRKILSINEISDITNYQITYGEPVVVEYKGNLYIIADSVKKAQDIQSVMSFSAQVYMINEGEEMTFLSEKEQDFLLNWDAEKYRKKIK